MKKFYHWILPLSVISALTSCGSNDPEQPVVPDEPTPEVKNELTFTSRLHGLTRATETEFEAEDAISLFAVKAAEGSSDVILASSGNHFHNLKFTYDGSQFQSDPPVYKAESDQLAYFAVYPYMESAAPNFNFTVYADQRDRKNYTLSDLCTANTGYLRDAQPNLSFYHRLSNLVVTLEGNHLGGNIEVEIMDALISADVDLNNLSVTSTSNRSDIIPNEYGTNTWRAVMAPQSYPAGTPIVRVSVNGKSYELAHSANIDLSSGRQVNIKLRIVNEVPVIVSGDIYPWNTGGEISYVIPEEILDKLDDHITINYGVNPPNIEGGYLIDPFECVYCEDEGNGGYNPGDIVTSHNILFHDQSMSARTINFSEVSVNQASYSLGNGAFISGEGDDFTVFFSTEGESRNIPVKEALVISGTKTDSGIANLEYAFVMVDKGDDPEHILMEKGVFRVFKDGDSMAYNAEWPYDVMPRLAPKSKKMFNNELFTRINK